MQLRLEIGCVLAGLDLLQRHDIGAVAEDLFQNMLSAVVPVQRPRRTISAYASSVVVRGMLVIRQVRGRSTVGPVRGAYRAGPVRCGAYQVNGRNNTVDHCHLSCATKKAARRRTRRERVSPCGPRGYCSRKWSATLHGTKGVRKECG